MIFQSALRCSLAVTFASLRSVSGTSFLKAAGAGAGAGGMAVFFASLDHDGDRLKGQTAHIRGGGGRRRGRHSRREASGGRGAASERSRRDEGSILRPSAERHGQARVVHT